MKLIFRNNNNAAIVGEEEAVFQMLIQVATGRDMEHWVRENISIRTDTVNDNRVTVRIHINRRAIKQLAKKIAKLLNKFKIEE